jgi:3-hydroxybutyrate dehydrogenase
MTDERPFAGRRALVTGSVAGLGQAMARALALAGCEVMLTGVETDEAAEAVTEALASEARVDVHYRQADLRHPAEIKALIAAAEAAMAGVDILVNNAVVRHFAPIEAFPVAAWDEALAVNLSAAFHAIRLTLPGMKARGFGRVVNMTSVYGYRGTPDRVDYVTTKTAIQGLTRAVAAETARGDVTCHALCPGAVLTPAAERRMQAMMAAENLARDAAEAKFLEGKGPSGRFVDVDSVARALLLVCGPAGRDMNGAILPIEGGWLAG